MKYRLSKSAEGDLSEIWDYTAQTWGETQAEKYLNKLEKGIVYGHPGTQVYRALFF